MSTTPGDGPKLPAPLPTSPPTSSAGQGEGQKKEQKKEEALKLFTLDSAPPTVPARVHVPGLLPGHEPFIFEFRLTFSADMQKKRDAFLMLAPTKQVEVEDEQILNEVCDLLARDPTGFGDFNGNAVGGSMAPGAKLRNYYVQAERTSPHALSIVKSVIRAANNIYWGSVTPREFFPPPTDTGARGPAVRQEGGEQARA